MKAVLIPGKGEMQVKDISAPEMGREEVLLKIHYAGFCGSDLNTFLERIQWSVTRLFPVTR